MHRNRNQVGISLVELLIATIIMGFVAAAAFGMVTLVATDSIKVENKCDNLNTVRSAMEKISRTIRMGRSIGDCFGNMNGGVHEGSITFPSNQNPIYPGQAPPNGWPVWADGTTQTSFTLSANCLIVQKPIFENDSTSPNFGFPLVIKGNQGNPQLGRATCNVITDIYRIVPDPNTNGEWLLQWVQLPGLAMTGYVPVQTGPTTLVRGIVGPLGNNGQPRVFNYICKPGIPQSNPGSLRQPGDGLTPALDNVNISNFSGVDVNLEVATHQNSGRDGAGNYIKPIRFAFKQNMYLRNNSLASITGP